MLAYNCDETLYDDGRAPVAAVKNVVTFLSVL